MESYLVTGFRISQVKVTAAIFRPITKLLSLNVHAAILLHMGVKFKLTDQLKPGM